MIITIYRRSCFYLRYDNQEWKYHDNIEISPTLKGYGNKNLLVLFERTFKVIYEDRLQLFRTLLGFRNILTKRSVHAVCHLGIIIDLIKVTSHDERAFSLLNMAQRILGVTLPNF